MVGGVKTDTDREYNKKVKRDRERARGWRRESGRGGGGEEVFADITHLGLQRPQGR